MLPTRASPSTSLVDHLLSAYLHSLTITNPNLTLDTTTKTLFVRPVPNSPRTVSVVSGSPTRHSPYVASFVGPGLLTACISSNSSNAGDPAEHVRITVQERVLAAQSLVFVIPQVGEDEFIAQEAALRAKRHDATMQFEYLTGPSTRLLGPNREFQRPGAGLPLLLKICSATAAQGYSVEEVLRVGRLVAKNLLSVGSSMRPDGQEGTGSSPLEPDLSLQVHEMLSLMLDSKLRDPGFVQVNSNEAVLHIAGHGGLTMLEMGAITTEAVRQMECWHVRPVRTYTESVPDLSAMGREEAATRDFAITILNVCNTDIGGPSMIELLDAPAEAAGWMAFVKDTSWAAKNGRLWTREVQLARPSGLRCTPDVILRAAANGSHAVTAFTKRNKLAGGYPYDSWYGIAAGPEGQNSHAQDMWNSAKGVVEALARFEALSDDLVILMNDIFSAIAPALDNPFGALVTIFFIALTQSFNKQSETADEVNVGLWVYALEDAYQELSEYAKHRPAMASTLEVFATFLQTLHSTGQVSKAADAAEQSPYADIDLVGRLLCAFLAGLAGPLDGALLQQDDVEEEGEAGEEHKHDWPATKAGIEPEPPPANKARGSLQTDMPEEDLEEKVCPPKSSKKQEESAPSATEQPYTITDKASSSPQLPESPSADAARGSGVIVSLGAVLGLPSSGTPPKKEVAAAEMVRTDESQLAGDSGPIQHSNFDTTIAGIPSRQQVPIPSRQMDETTLMDIVQQQIEMIRVSSEGKVAGQRDLDGEEYEFV